MGPRRHVKRPDKQAWVFSSDTTALAAYRYAEKNNIKIPPQVSIISLENDPSYYPFGLSTCVPDWETSGYLMANAIIGDLPVKKTRKGFIATQAQFLRRLTTYNYFCWIALARYARGDKPVIFLNWMEKK